VPLQLYQILIIEENFGRSSNNFKKYFDDMVVENALSLMVIPIVLYGYIYVVETGGEYFFIYLELFVLMVNIILMNVRPNLIAPLFNKFEVLEEGELKERIKDLAASIKFPLQQIFKMDGSKNSDHSNAYFFGL